MMEKMFAVEEIVYDVFESGEGLIIQSKLAAEAAGFWAYVV